MNSDVFITDGHWRKTLAAVRGLGQQGVRVAVGESTWPATVFFSKYCRKRLIYPSLLFEPEKFIEFLLKELKNQNYRMLLPMEDATCNLIAANHDPVANLTYLPLVNKEKLEFVQRKDKVLQLAAHIGIPIPETFYITNLDQLSKLKDQLPYPVVIKPKTGAGAEGIIYSPGQGNLIDDYLKVHHRYPFPLIQEKIAGQGPGFGASFLMDENSNVMASFVHKRLREYPVTGGASTLRESVLQDEVRQMGEALLKNLGWFGVAMVEFKYDFKDQTYKLMEINPRFWGSLALAVAAGVNFPYLLYKMACGKKFKPIENYKIGQRCRWLLPGDILHFIHNPARAELKPGFFDFFDRQTTYDIISLKDPMPILGRILTPLTFLYDQDMQCRLAKRK